MMSDYVIGSGAFVGEGAPSGIGAWDSAYLNAGGSFDWTYTLNDIYNAAGAVRSIAGAVGQVTGAVTQGVNMASPFAALMMADAAAARQEAAAYYQQGLYQVQAADTLRLAQLRTDQDRKYAAIQAGRKLQQAEQTARNYQIAGNTLLRTMERTNAAVRARAAASGVAYNEGSALGVQQANVAATYRDVGIADLNALTARILGFEDASAMFLAAEQQADLTMTAAETQARQLELAGDFAVQSGGLLANATLVQGVMDFAKTYKNPFA